MSQSQTESCVRIKVEPAELRELMRRQDARPLRDFALYFLLLAGLACLTVALWGHWSAAIALFAYSTLYSTGAQSREHDRPWHRLPHEMAEQALFEITSFMAVRETFLRTHSHDAHHKHTIIVERDPEIVTPAPPRIAELVMNIFMITRTLRNSGTSSFIPAAVCRHRIASAAAPHCRGAAAKARLWLVVMAATAGLALYLGSWLPVCSRAGPDDDRRAIKQLFAVSQHVGLARDVFDYRLNTRTIHLGPVLGFLYMNMQYHLEHHLYPNVPYYNLPRLHELIRDRCPPAYDGLWAVYAELIRFCGASGGSVGVHPPRDPATG